MTQNKNFKRRVRARAAKTGESYTSALQHVQQPGAETPTPSIRIAVAQTTLFDDPRDVDQMRALGSEIRQLMQEAKELGTRLIHFPEGTICSPSKWLLSELGQDIVGNSDWSRFAWSTLREELNKIRQLSGELKLWTVLGSTHQLSVPYRPHNSLYVISDLGELHTRYDERLLSNTKISFMYSPGKTPITFEVDGIRFGCSVGMETHFPEIFAEYEKLDVDCVLFSTTGQSTLTAPAFAAEALGHAASNSFWVSYSAHAPQSVAVPSGIAAPDGRWAAQCAIDGKPAIAIAKIKFDPKNYAKAWRRRARQDIYSASQIDNDPRSDTRNTF